jgi:hypothetical protein
MLAGRRKGRTMKQLKNRVSCCAASPSLAAARIVTAIKEDRSRQLAPEGGR